MLLLLGTVVAFAVLDWPWRLAVIGALAIIEALEIALWLKLRRQRAVTGEEGLIGARGRAVTDVSPEGRVRVRGALWNARAEGSLPAGIDVEVVGVEGLTLHVRASGAPSHQRDHARPSGIPAPARDSLRARGGERGR